MRCLICIQYLHNKNVNETAKRQQSPQLFTKNDVQMKKKSTITFVDKIEKQHYVAQHHIHFLTVGNDKPPMCGNEIWRGQRIIRLKRLSPNFKSFPFLHFLTKLKNNLTLHNLVCSDADKSGADIDEKRLSPDFKNFPFLHFWTKLKNNLTLHNYTICSS